jgi:hypothetical protein
LPESDRPPEPDRLGQGQRPKPKRARKKKASPFKLCGALVGDVETVRAEFMAKNPEAIGKLPVAHPFYSYIMEGAKGVFEIPWPGEKLGPPDGPTPDEAGLPWGTESELHSNFQSLNVQRFLGFTMAWADAVFGEAMVSAVFHLDEERPHFHVIVREGPSAWGQKEGLDWPFPFTEAGLVRSYTMFMQNAGCQTADFLLQCHGLEGTDNIRESFYQRAKDAQAKDFGPIMAASTPPEPLKDRETFDRHFPQTLPRAEFLRQSDEIVISSMGVETERFREKIGKHQLLNQANDGLDDMLMSDEDSPVHMATHPLFLLENMFELADKDFESDGQNWSARLPKGQYIRGQDQWWEDKAAGADGLGIYELAAHLMGYAPDKAHLTWNSLPPGFYGGDLAAGIFLREYAEAPLPRPPKPNRSLWPTAKIPLTQGTGLNAPILELFYRRGYFYPDVHGRVVFPCLGWRGYLAWDPQAQEASGSWTRASDGEDNSFWATVPSPREPPPAEAEPPAASESEAGRKNILGPKVDRKTVALAKANGLVIGPRFIKMPALTPKPKLATTPAPNPASSPTPSPAPSPASNPTPNPASSSAPSPAPSPAPRPASNPMPNPASSSAPSPAPSPAPRPALSPAPRPALSPMAPSAPKEVTNDEIRAVPTEVPETESEDWVPMPLSGSKFFKGHYLLEGPGQWIFFTRLPMDALVIKALFPEETVLASQMPYFDSYARGLLEGKRLIICGNTSLAKWLANSGNPFGPDPELGFMEGPWSFPFLDGPETADAGEVGPGPSREKTYGGEIGRGPSRSQNRPQGSSQGQTKARPPFYKILHLKGQVSWTEALLAAAERLRARSRDWGSPVAASSAAASLAAVGLNDRLLLEMTGQDSQRILSRDGLINFRRQNYPGTNSRAFSKRALKPPAWFRFKREKVDEAELLAAPLIAGARGIDAVGRGGPRDEAELLAAPLVAGAPGIDAVGRGGPTKSEGLRPKVETTIATVPKEGTDPLEEGDPEERDDFGHRPM